MVDSLTPSPESHARGARSRHRRKAWWPGAGSGRGGTWKDLTDNVNFMASNLTGQVRNIAEVAHRDRERRFVEKITVDVRGEILQLKKR